MSRVVNVDDVDVKLIEHIDIKVTAENIDSL